MFRIDIVGDWRTARGLRHELERRGRRRRRRRSNDERSRPHRLMHRARRYRGVKVRVKGPRDLDRPAREVPDLVRKGREKIISHPLKDELVLRPKREYAIREILELDPTKPLVKR